MRNSALIPTIIFVLSALSIQTVQGQDRAKHPSRQETVLSSLDVYAKWKEHVDPNNDPSLTYQSVAAVTRRLDTQTASADLTIVTRDPSRYQGSSRFVVELQPFNYRISSNGDFSRYSLGNRIQLDLPVMGQAEHLDGKIISNPNLTFFAQESANGVEVVVRFIRGHEKSSITFLLPLTDQARSGAGGQTSGGSMIGGQNSNHSSRGLTKIHFKSRRTRLEDGECKTWTLSCGDCNKSWRCSNKDPEFNCITCTVTNCTDCDAT